MRRLAILFVAGICLMSGCAKETKEYSNEEVLKILEAYYNPYFVEEHTTTNDDDNKDKSEERIYIVYDDELEMPEEYSYKVKVDLKTGKVKELYSDGSISATYDLEVVETIISKNSSNAAEKDDVQDIPQKERQDIEYSFGENCITGYGFDILLKEDGTVLARGTNTNGELGNGTLFASEIWQEVEGINGVKQIVCKMKKETPTIYALKNDGTVWYWGNEYTVPQQVQNIAGVSRMIAKTFGHYGGGDADYYGSRVDLVDEEGHLIGGISEGEVYTREYTGEKINDSGGVCGYVSDDKIYYWGIENYLEYEKTIENYESYQAYDLNGKEIKMGRVVKMCGQADEEYRYYLTEDNELYHYNMRKGYFEQCAINVKDYYRVWGDGGWRGTAQDAFEILLHTDGELLTTGDNNYGELGNGTKDPFEKWWTVDIPPVHSIYVPFTGNVFAIDEDNNLWAWGRDYDTLPQLLYNLNDVANEN